MGKAAALCDDFSLALHGLKLATQKAQLGSQFAILASLCGGVVVCERHPIQLGFDLLDASIDFLNGHLSDTPFLFCELIIPCQCPVVKSFGKYFLDLFFNFNLTFGPECDKMKL